MGSGKQELWVDPWDLSPFAARAVTLHLGSLYLLCPHRQYLLRGSMTSHLVVTSVVSPPTGQPVPPSCSFSTLYPEGSFTVQIVALLLETLCGLLLLSVQNPDSLP